MMVAGPRSHSGRCCGARAASGRAWCRAGDGKPWRRVDKVRGMRTFFAASVRSLRGRREMSCAWPSRDLVTTRLG